MPFLVNAERSEFLGKTNFVKAVKEESTVYENFGSVARPPKSRVVSFVQPVMAVAGNVLSPEGRLTQPSAALLSPDTMAVIPEFRKQFAPRVVTVSGNLTVLSAVSPENVEAGILVSCVLDISTVLSALHPENIVFPRVVIVFGKSISVRAVQPEKVSSWMVLSFELGKSTVLRAVQL